MGQQVKTARFSVISMHNWMFNIWKYMDDQTLGPKYVREETTATRYAKRHQLLFALVRTVGGIINGTLSTSR